MLKCRNSFAFCLVFAENIGIKSPSLFEGDMRLNSAQRLAAMQGLDVDKAKGSARGSVINGNWPGGVLIYYIDPQIGNRKNEEETNIGIFHNRQKMKITGWFPNVRQSMLKCRPLW